MIKPFVLYGKLDEMAAKRPTNGNLERQRYDRALARRDTLKQAGLATYEISPLNVGIVCLCCGLVSANPSDVKEHYCSFCNTFHSEDVSRMDGV